MTESPIAQATEAFLDRFVGLFNAGVRHHDFSEYLASFAQDAVLEFDGVPDPALYGKAAIAERYRDDPPDDQITVVRSKIAGDRIMAEFRWHDIPEATGGCFVIDLRNGKISYLTVAFGGPASRCFGKT